MFNFGRLQRISSSSIRTVSMLPTFLCSEMVSNLRLWYQHGCVSIALKRLLVTLDVNIMPLKASLRPCLHRQYQFDGRRDF
jgi:hypothetical protein